MFREKIEKINNQSRVMQDSEPARNQSFTELISELRVAQVGIYQACKITECSAFACSTEIQIPLETQGARAGVA